ncbi:MAG: hypothetical protein HOP23_18745 [Methylococcaceae bacterium]|nr:hypothetical protein [Methylococcaceae bacterium]
MDCIDDDMTLERAGLHSHEASSSLYPSPSFRQGLPESRLHGCIEAQPSMALDTRFPAGMTNYLDTCE